MFAAVGSGVKNDLVGECRFVEQLENVGILKIPENEYLGLLSVRELNEKSRNVDFSRPLSAPRSGGDGSTSQLLRVTVSGNAGQFSAEDNLQREFLGEGRASARIHDLNCKKNFNVSLRILSGVPAGYFKLADDHMRTLGAFQAIGSILRGLGGHPVSIDRCPHVGGLLGRRFFDEFELLVASVPEPIGGNPQFVGGLPEPPRKQGDESGKKSSQYPVVNVNEFSRMSYSEKSDFVAGALLLLGIIALLITMITSGDEKNESNNKHRPDN